MDIHHHTQPANLERYAFIWSQVRLVIASLALLLGGVPPVLYLFPRWAIIFALLKLAWIISGVASFYLLYRWYFGGQMLFGHKRMNDTIAFFIMVVSGINLGLVGLIGQNIGMSISSSHAVFIIVAIVYLIATYHLYTRWKASGRRIF